MTASLTRDRRVRDTWVWLGAVALVAANLRPVITSVPPMIDQLASRYGLSAVAAGTLTTLPALCMAIFAPVAALASRRTGSSVVLAASVALVAVGCVLRGFFGLPGLYAGTVVAGVGVAVAGAILPSLVRSRLPGRVGPATGVYTAAIITGAMVAAAVTEPLRVWLDTSAQAVLSVWALPALIALLAWLAVARGDGVPAGATRLPWRSGSAWLGALFMGGQSLLFYATLAWLAASYTSRGVSTSEAGLLLALFSATQIVTALVLPVWAHRSADARPAIGVSVGLTIAGLLLLGAAPTAAPWLWAALVGLGMGGNLSLALVVLTDMAPTPADASGYTGMAFLVGYLMAAAGPVAAGALVDLTGGYSAVFVTLAVLGVGTLIVGIAAARPRRST